MLKTGDRVRYSQTFRRILDDETFWEERKDMIGTIIDVRYTHNKTLFYRVKWDSEDSPRNSIPAYLVRA